MVGITGTNGKSTVTTLLGRMAERAGVRVRVGGNLGQPALDLLDRGPTDLYVLELSSFQLDTTHSLKLKAAVVLNVSADHMDRYATLRHYADSKARIFANSETAVVNADEPEVVRMPRAGQRVITFSMTGTSADFSLMTPPRISEPWLARRGAAAAAGGRAEDLRPPQRRQRARDAGAGRRAAPAARADARRAARVHRPAAPRAVGRGHRAACATSTTPRAPTSARRSPRSAASPARWW